MTDLAEALAPGIPHEIIGIRPGEKLHEVMITPDDSRNTVEHKDRYVILPAFKFWDANTDIPKDSVQVDDDFLYSSDSNDDWLDAASLGALIGGL